MASQGPLSPSTVANQTGVGSVAWSNPGNAVSSNDSRATASLGLGVTSNYLKATNFGFSIPGGSTIDGIVVEIERSNAGIQLISDSEIKIVKGGSIGSTNKSAGAAWPTGGVDAYATFGGSSDLWGESWTDSDINASDFGVVLAAVKSAGVNANTAQVDHVRVTVHYTAGGGSSIRTQAIWT